MSWIVCGEVCLAERLEDSLADGVEVAAGVPADQQIQRRPLAAGRERGVVHVVKLPLRETTTEGLLQEPQLLVVADVAVVPDQGAHDLVVLAGKVLVGESAQQPPRPLSRLRQSFDDKVPGLTALCIHTMNRSDVRPHFKGVCTLDGSISRR